MFCLDFVFLFFFLGFVLEYKTRDSSSWTGFDTANRVAILQVKALTPPNICTQLSSQQRFMPCMKMECQHEEGSGRGEPAYWLIKRTSTVLRSKSSKKGRAARPS